MSGIRIRGAYIFVSIYSHVLGAHEYAQCLNIKWLLAVKFL